MQYLAFGSSLNDDSIKLHLNNKAETHVPTCDDIQLLIEKAETDRDRATDKRLRKQDLEFNEYHSIFIETKFHLFMAQKKLLEAQSGLLSLISRKQQSLNQNSIEVFEALPDDREFRLFNKTQQMLLEINNWLIDLTLDNLEFYIKHGLLYLTDALFDELNTYSGLEVFKKRIHNLRRLISIRKKEA